MEERFPVCRLLFKVSAVSNHTEEAQGLFGHVTLTSVSFRVYRTEHVFRILRLFNSEQH
jgi:hypothetical protein